MICGRFQVLGVVIVMFCKNCGMEIENNSNFCPNCGYQLISFQKNTLFDFKQKQSGKNIFIYYIILLLLYFVISSLLIPFFAKFYDPYNLMSSFEQGMYYAKFAAPIFAIISSLFFVVQKKLYKNCIAYILTIIGAICPPFIGLIFIVLLALL